MINPRPAYADTQPVVLVKSTGRRFGFEDLETAYAVAEAFDRIECMNGAHAVASALAAKSNVTINLLPGATVTFAEEITIGAGITNFKIVGDGNVVFTTDAFKLTGIIGVGNEINVRGNVTIGALALHQEAELTQVTYVGLFGRNVTITGANFGDGFFGIMLIENGTEVGLHISAENILAIPAMRINTALGAHYLVLKADTINCSNNNYHTGASITVVARVLNLGDSSNFADPEANPCLYELSVDEINFNSSSGIYINDANVTMTFNKHVRIKNSSNANPAHVINSGSSVLITFREGAVLYTAGGANSRAASPSGIIYAGRTVRSNKILDDTGPVTMDGADFETNAALVL